MGSVKIPYYVVAKKTGRGYWSPTKRMKALGFGLVRCGLDGPDAWRIANEWNARWQETRLGRQPAPKHVWPRGSLGEAFDRFRKTSAWRDDKKPRTREDWERAWAHIAPIFGDVAPRTVTLEHIDGWYAALKAAKGVQESHRAMKIWRALWQVAAAMQYCVGEHDPSFGIRNEAPQPRSAVWREGEVVRLAKEAWRQGYLGLACIIGIAYDTQLSPVDVRTLTLGESRVDGESFQFERDRTKSGRAAIGTLSRRTQALVRAYVARLPSDFLPSSPVFLTRRGAAYRRNSLAEDFRDVRAIVLPGDRRQLQDMRRTGAIEAQSGGADHGIIAQKMANSAHTSRQLQKTYMPVNQAAVEQADEARKRGRWRIRENNSGPKVESLRPGESNSSNRGGRK